MTGIYQIKMHVTYLMRITYKMAQPQQNYCKSFAAPDTYVLNFNSLLYFRSRSDVQTCTSWKAPIIWEGMFDPKMYDQMHKKEGSSVALTVFAVGRFVYSLMTVWINCCHT